MKKENSLLFVTLVFTLLAISWLALAANAAEVQLAGVRLDESVLDLLARPGWGQPSGIGPLAELRIQAAAAATTAGTTITPRSPGRSAVPGRRGLSDTAARGRRASSGMAEEQVGARRGRRGAYTSDEMPGGLPPGSGAQVNSGLMNQTAPATTTTSAKGELRGTQELQYWLYNRPGGVRVILGVAPSGTVSTITAQGSSSTEVFTSQGIGLGDAFSALFSAYGYPDKTEALSDGLLLIYSDQDIRFILKGMQVTEITIGRPPAPTPAPVQATMPGAARNAAGQTMPGGRRARAAGTGTTQGRRTGARGGGRASSAE
jgi:hypothetical protein